MVYTFGKEKVPVLSQTYREFQFSFLMEKTLFGDNLSIKKKKRSGVKNEKASIIAHLFTEKNEVSLQ